MDKKNTTIGVLLLAAALASLYLGSKLAPPPPPAPAAVQATAANPLASNQAATSASTSIATSPSDATFAAVAKDSDGAQITTLANDYIEVHFTDFGGRPTPILPQGEAIGELFS